MRSKPPPYHLPDALTVGRHLEDHALSQSIHIAWVEGTSIGHESRDSRVVPPASQMLHLVVDHGASIALCEVRSPSTMRRFPADLVSVAALQTRLT